ncbi:MAG: prolyl oligopeptidase family serine peptidase [Prevotellaceae bacterium]|nr:prolyl oligopeptidase family serine peptidase [Prevotellaceae bacterium]
MKKIIAPIAAMVLLCSCGGQSGPAKPVYPGTKKVDQVDEYFGVQVEDPYRWLEDDNSEETKAWVKEQNKVTFAYLDAIPFRNALKERITMLWNYPKQSSPSKYGEFYIYSKNNGLQNQSVVYVKQEEDGEERVLIDPNNMSDKGTVALSGLAVREDGKYAAYMVAQGGSDWNSAYVMDVATGETLNDELKWIKFSGLSWYGDGFFYSRYDVPKAGAELTTKNEFHKVYYHKLGDNQENDELIFVDDVNPLRNCSAGVTDDQKYLIIYQTETTSGNVLYIKNLEKDDPFVQFNDGFTSDWGVLDHINGMLYLQTNYGAPNYRVVTVDANNPKIAGIKDLIPESENVMQGVNYVGGKLFVSYLKDAHSQIKIFDIDGKSLGEVELPTVGSCSGIYGKPTDNIAYFSFTSFTFPTIIYEYNVAENTYTEYFKPSIDFDFDSYETKQVFYTSKDGTKVPMFIVYKKGIAMDGSNPTLLYGYGGFNASMTPGFSVTRLAWLEQGGVYVMANIRGGGEYGEKWHKSGTKLQKQNVFDDFIAAAEYLVNEKYTSPVKLVMQGGSNGGLLVGAVANQRPDLFAVAIPQVGVMDMLRFHKFTIGWAWTGDYGSSDNSQEEFEYLHGYSPLHNIISDVDYPATLVTTADHDDRVVPAHSFKYISTLQEKQKDRKNPMLIRIQTDAGHGAGKPTAIAIQEVTDIYSFIFYNVGVTPKY